MPLTICVIFCDIGAPNSGVVFPNQSLHWQPETLAVGVHRAMTLAVCVISCDFEGGFANCFPPTMTFCDIKTFHTVPSRVIGVKGHLTMGVPK